MSFNYKTFKINENPQALVIALNRPAAKNSINLLLLKELSDFLDKAEKQPQKCILIESHGEYFCSGMDLKEIALADPAIRRGWAVLFMATLKRLTSMPKMLIVNISGKVLAGGVGLLATADWIIATQEASFKLSEGFWGIIPAMASPFIMRRIGFQPTQAMALTGRTVSAHEALAIHLVDEIVPNLENATNKILQKMNRISQETIKENKMYFSHYWKLTDRQEAAAIDTFLDLLAKPAAQKAISDFVQHGRLPWE